MESYYGTAFAGFAEDDIFYEGQFDSEVIVPEGFTVTIPTTGRAIVDEAVDSIVPADILVTYPPRGITKKAEEDSQNVGRFVKHAWSFIRKNSSDIDPVRDFIRNLFRSGKACFKIVPDYTLWPVLPKDEEDALRELGSDKLKERVATIKRIRESNFPLTVRSLPPQCVMEDPTVSARKLWIIERYTMDISEVRSLFSQEVEDLRERDFWTSSTYRIHEVWTATYVDHAGRIVEGRRFLFVNDSLVEETENPYDELPYIVKYSGFGREAYEGRPEYKSVGFYTRQVKSMLLAEARRATHFDAIMSQLAFPIAFMDESVEDSNISFQPGAVNFVPVQVMERIQNTFVSPPIPAPEYLQSLNFIAGQIERGTVSRSVRGASLPGADSAAQYSLQSNNAKLRMESCKQAAEQAMSLGSTKFLQYVDLYFNNKVSVFAAEGNVDKYTIGPGNIQGRYVIGITFQPNEDAIKERKLILANDAINKGGMSPFDAYQFAGFENPLELIGRRMAYDIMMSDEVKKYMAQQQLLEWGVDAQAVEMQGRQKDMEMQYSLRSFSNALELGTMAGGGPQNQVAGQVQAPQQMPQQGPPAPMGGAGGAPQQVVPPQVAGMMGDLNSLAGGINPGLAA